jgi:dimethylargininase
LLPKSEGDALRAAVVCAPDVEYTRVDDTVRQNFVRVPDPDASREQHARLRAALAEHGARVHEVPELSAHPNSVFVRDVALVTPEGFVRLRMGLPARSGEEAWLEGHLIALGLPRVGAIEPPGTLEGGDVFLLDDVALVGLSPRANAEGARQLARLLEPMGYRVRTAPVFPPALHLGSVLSPVGPGRVVVVEGTLPADFLEGLDVIGAPRVGVDASANVLCLADNEVLADAGECPATLEALDGAGVSVRTLELSEFAKGSGGPTCLVLPVGRG